jgi:hypothetical protein
LDVLGVREVLRELSMADELGTFLEMEVSGTLSEIEQLGVALMSEVAVLGT